MINAIFAFFIFSLLFRRVRSRAVWIGVSVLALAQLAQPTLWAILGLLAVEQWILYVYRRRPFPTRYFPLIYAAVLIVAHHALKGNIPGFSYLTLASSLDLWVGFREGTSFSARFFNLISFPKTLVGPITSPKDHVATPAGDYAKLALFGILKGFILVNLWRAYVPAPVWTDLSGPLEYFWFGLWNYIHLYLEFSGACDLVAATFWLYGFGCPLNFERPYLSLSVTEFWKRWHITLGLWIKNHVFIAFGGSQVSPGRVYLNLMIAMTLSGAWHGITPNYIGWGVLQGALLCGERAIGLEAKLTRAGIVVRVASWLATQILVTISWILFFGRF